MIVGFDGNEANVPERVGVNQYAFDILHALHEFVKKEGKPIKIVVYLKNPPQKDFPKANKHLEYKVLPGGFMWVLTRLAPYLITNPDSIDVLFSPSHYAPPLSKVPKVIAIHDLKYLEFPGQFKKTTYWQLKYWTAISVSISKAIIAVSNSTKEEITKHYPKATKKVRVVHHGVDLTRFNSNISKEKIKRVKKKYTIVGEYILYIGTLKPSKNVEGLLDAFAKISDEMQLVIAGKKGWLYDKVFKKVKKLGLEKKVVFTDFLPEDDKPALMAGAKALASPSFTEGFGMHAIESMASGTPVVVSKLAAFKEVVKDSGVFVDQDDANDIARGILQILNMNEKEYNKLVKRGLAQAQKFSWEKAAGETLEVLEQ